MDQELENMNAKQLSDMLHLVLDKQDDNGILNEVAHTEFMTECLNKPIIGDKVQEQILSGIPELLKKSFILTGNSSLSELLFNPQSSLNDLKKAKSFFNTRSKQEKDNIKKEVCVALYYAFIGAALVYHKSKITGYSISDLQTYLKRLLTKNWIPDTVKQIYIQACDYVVAIQSMDTRI